MDPNLLFSLRYSGNSVMDGSIAADEFGPALTALNAFLQRAKDLAYGNDGAFEVRVIGLDKGSFIAECYLQTVQTYNTSVTLFTAPPASALANLIGITGGLLGTLTFLKGRKPEKIETDKGGSTFYIDNRKYQTLSEVRYVFADLQAREELYKIVAPLAKEDIDTFEILKGPNRVPVRSINKDELWYIQDPITLNQMEEAILSDSTREVTVHALKIDFRANQAWRITEGGSHQYSAILKDTVFVKKMQNDEVAFSNGDVFKIDLRTIQTRSSQGDLRARYEIVKVLSHIRVPKQTSFKF